MIRYLLARAWWEVRCFFVKWHDPMPEEPKREDYRWKNKSK